MTYQGRKEPGYECSSTKIGEGGEGTILDVVGHPDLVAKIYKSGTLSRSTAEKLTVMINAVPPGAEKCVAWPLDILLEDGRVCGFVMKKFTGLTPLVHLLSDPGFTWDKRIVVAYNLCDMVEMIHASDQCIGDMNPKNFGVDTNTGKIVTFDADSFHFQQDGRLYPCYVGDEHYYPRELQILLKRKNDMRTLNPSETFSQYTDLFALAVLVFQLLFQGHNPFVERTMKEYEYGSSKYIHEPVENILNRMSPYFNPRPGVDIPVMSVPVTILPAKMQTMFRDSLIGENRARPGEWKRELLRLGQQLNTCSRKGHKYWAGLDECPWCRVEEKKPEVRQIMRGEAISGENAVNSQRQQPAQAKPVQPMNTGNGYQNTPSGSNPLFTTNQSVKPQKSKKKWIWCAIFVLFIIAGNVLNANQRNVPPRPQNTKATAPVTQPKNTKATAPVTQPQNKGTNPTSPPSIEAQIKTWNSTGDEYYNKKDYTKAAEYYRQAADQGSAYAQDKLGFLFCNGLGVAQDYAKAVKYYQLAADQKYGYAQASLGSMYYYARGVVQDYAKAAKYYQMAADQGIAYAQYNTGIMYEYGKGVAQNSDIAAKYYQMAADQGYEDAQKKLKKFPKYYKVIKNGEYNGFKYCIYNYGEAEITGWNRARTDTSVKIPSMIEGSPVTSIREEAFSGCNGLTSVIIPGSITSIGNSAFLGCYGLTHVTISDGVREIGNKAFGECEALANVIIPDSVTTIGSEAFAGCVCLSSIAIPSSVTTIGSWAFTRCDLNSVSIPGRVTYIGERAFSYCESLRSVTLPNSLTSTGKGVFEGCVRLTSITIPNNVTTIDDAAFAYCESLKSVTIPGSVTWIGERAFNLCDSLTNLTIPSSVNHIGTDAFTQSKKILTLTVTRGSYAETYCKKNYLKYKTN